MLFSLLLLPFQIGSETPPARTTTMITGEAKLIDGQPIPDGVVCGFIAGRVGASHISTSCYVTTPGRFRLEFEMAPADAAGCPIAVCWIGTPPVDRPEVPLGAGRSVLSEVVSAGALDLGTLVLAEQRSSQGTDPDSEDVDAITKKRRADGKHDPIALCLHPSSAVVLDFPEQPEFLGYIVNVDEERQPVTVLNGGGYRSGRLERWAMDAVRDGTHAPRVNWPGGFGGGMAFYETLRFGEPLGFSIPLRSYLQPLEAGTWKVAISYSNDEPIADRPPAFSGAVFRTHYFSVEMRPRTVRVTPAEQARIRQQLRDAATSASVPIAQESLGHAGYPSTDKTTAESQLLNGGWSAFGVLLHDIDESEPSVDIMRWRLALLYDLSGIHDPSSVAGSTRRLPLARKDTALEFFQGLQGMRGVEHGEPDVPGLRKLLMRWKAMRTGINLVVE